jgi:hypothetical protein
VPAFVGIVSSAGLIEIECESRSLLSSLLAEVPDDGKTKIALIILVWNLSKEEAKTFALLLANKQAKSLIGAAIPQRGEGNKNKGSKGGQRNKVVVKKEVIKEEVKEEEDDIKVKFKEETDNDNEFPDVNKVIKRKQKVMPNSLYPENQYVKS